MFISIFLILLRAIFVLGSIFGVIISLIEKNAPILVASIIMGYVWIRFHKLENALVTYIERKKLEEKIRKQKEIQRKKEEAEKEKQIQIQKQKRLQEEETEKREKTRQQLEAQARFNTRAK